MGSLLQQIFTSPFFLLVLVWASVWKGVALWKAVTKRQLVWFVILLLANTLGILELLYIFWLARWPIDPQERLLKLLNEKIGRKVPTS